MTAEDVRQMVSEVEDKVKMLSEADPEAKGDALFGSRHPPHLSRPAEK
jgi:hypothetical protein